VTFGDLWAEPCIPLLPPVVTLTVNLCLVCGVSLSFCLKDWVRLAGENGSNSKVAASFKELFIRGHVNLP
jgi:hypothetical protein